MKFIVSDKLLPVVDEVRDKISREDFFREALELGIGTCCKPLLA
jgi:hypothetical protein